jgi:hypothetical protein
LSAELRQCYNEFPYLSFPFPQSHPDRLATTGWLFGTEPACVPKREQFIDVLRGRTFRETLLVHRDVQLTRKVSPQQVMAMRVASRARPVRPQPDLQSNAIEEFESPEGKVSTPSRLSKAAFLTLAECWPKEAVGDPDLVQVGQVFCAVQHYDNGICQAIGEGIAPGCAAGALRVSGGAGSGVTFAALRSERARLQSSRGASGGER